LIPDLISKPLREIAAQPRIRETFNRLYEQHLRAMEIIRKRAELRDRVVYLDIADQEFEGFNKFIPYYLFPESVYNVALSKSKERIKIAVGSNPWNPMPKGANLASICERFGGGGHAKVAAISLPPGDLDRGHEIAGEIVRGLRATLR
ncbi:MAG: phosphoesterase, partial [Acidobacteria bacterium]|nr:phosphoesterase [Acidobacteriota bacterium]